MRFDSTALLPLVAKLGGFLRTGFDHYVAMKAAGIEPSADAIAMVVGGQINGWNPEFKGQALLDSATKAACAQFLGGVAFNIAKAQSGDSER